MDTVFTLGNIITALTLLVTGSIAWGRTTQRIKQIEDRHLGCDKKFEKIESDHNGAISDLRDEIKNISNSLHELIGMVRVFIGKKGE